MQVVYSPTHLGHDITHETYMGVAIPANEVAERAEIIRRRMAYEADPQGFAARWGAEQAALAGRLAEARQLLPEVTLPDPLLDVITTLSSEAGVRSLRADLVVNNLVGYALTQGEIFVKSDGTPWRPLVHVEDIARAYVALPRHHEPLLA